MSPLRVSVLVPFTPEPGAAGERRTRNWEWLERRWRCVLPGVDLVVGEDHGTPFSKTCAVNDAYSRAAGDVLVVADADSWVPLAQLASAVEYTSRTGVLVVPWSTAHRLNERDSNRVRRTDPATPHPVSSAMRRQAEPYRPSPSTAGMVFVVMRESFERAGGMDPRFRGWGAEDVCFRLACDTVLGRYKIMLGDAYALHHERDRQADGGRVWHQDPGEHNAALADRYWSAVGKPREMLALCREHALPGAATPVELGPEAARRPVPTPGRQPVPGTLVHEFGYGGTRVGERIAL